MDFYTREKILPDVTRILDKGLEYMYLVEGEDKALLIDTGVGYGSLADFVKTLTDKPVEVVCTHGHVDHAGGAYGFDRVWLSPKDFDVAAEHTKVRQRYGYILGNLPDADEGLFIPPYDKNFLPLEEGQVFNLGGCTVTAVPLQGHTQGMMAMLLEPQGVMLLGDGCNSHTFLFLDHSTSVAEYKMALQNLKKWDERYTDVWYSHLHNKGGKEIVDEGIALCDVIMAGEDEKIPVQIFPGVKTCMAKEEGEDLLCKDGSACNILYNPDKIK